MQHGQGPDAEPAEQEEPEQSALETDISEKDKEFYEDAPVETLG